MYHIACSTDNNYVQHSLAMICSILENSNCNGLIFHILIDELDLHFQNELTILIQKYDAECCFHKVDTTALNGVKFRDLEPLTLAAYYRILLPSIVDKNISKILYLDVDIIVLRSLLPLYEIDLSGYALAAVKDVSEYPLSDLHRMQLNFSYNDTYFNSGVMMINLDYWRKNNAERKLIAFSQKERTVFYHDQDALNCIFKGQWLELSPKWNHINMVLLRKSMFRTQNDEDDYINAPCVIHYAAKHCKPWLNIPFIQYRKKYHYYLTLSGWVETAYIPIGAKLYIWTVLYNIFVIFQNFIYKCPPLIGSLIFLFWDVLRFLFWLLSFKKISKFKCTQIRNIK